MDDQASPALPERRTPTHLLRIVVPLALDEPPRNYDAVAQAVRLVLAVSRAGFDGYICDDVQVSMEDAAPSAASSRAPGA